MVYALALSGDVDRSLVENLYSSRDKFSAHGQALMALLLLQVKDSRAQEFVKLLEAERARRKVLSFRGNPNARKCSTSLPTIPLRPRRMRSKPWRTSTRRAIYCRAPRAGSMEHRSDGYYWDSTEQTATAIYGLIDYLKISGELKPNYTLSVYSERPKTCRPEHYGKGCGESASHRARPRPRRRFMRAQTKCAS